MTTKKLLSFAAGAAVALVANAGHSQTTTTSIQFTQHPYLGSDLASTDVAGVVPSANWNVVDPLGANGIVYLNGATQTKSGSGLLESDGLTNSGISYNLISGGADNQGSSLPAGPNKTLLGAGAGTAGAGNSSTDPNMVYGGGVHLTLSGLNAGDSYSFIVYVGGADYVNAEASVSLSTGQIYYIDSTNGGWSSSAALSLVNNSTTTDFSTANANNPGGAAAYGANYVEFDNITGVSSETITLTGLGQYPGGVFQPAAGNNPIIWHMSGVQVLDTPGTIPEPATIWSAALGLLGLVGFQRKRFFKA